jgi:hypothetical protein
VRAGKESALPALLRTRFQAPLHALAAAEVGELPAQVEHQVLLKVVEPLDCSLTRTVLQAREALLEQRAVREA